MYIVLFSIVSTNSEANVSELVGTIEKVSLVLDHTLLYEICDQPPSVNS